MISFFLYLIGSIIMYLFVISISKYFKGYYMKVMLYGFILGIYLNISKNGIVTKYLHIVYSDSIAILSSVMIVIYIVTIYFDD